MKLSFLHFEEAMSVGLEIQCIYLVPAIFFVQKMLSDQKKNLCAIWGVKWSDWGWVSPEIEFLLK